MSLNKQRGNMYPFVTHTWNVIKGKCPHDCSYCYMKKFPQGELRFDEKELKTDLGRDNYIFVGSSCDMFAESIPSEWIKKVLEYCEKFKKNKYLFQTKNPERFHEFWNEFIEIEKYNEVIFGTTVETNRETPQSKAPSTYKRLQVMKDITENDFTMITIEPIMEFDLDNLVGLILKADPKFVNIGADSKGHGLNEPKGQKIRQLISSLKEFTEVRIKNNLNRLLKEDN